MKNLHVEKFGSVWRLRRAGSSKYIDLFRLRRYAIDAAKKLAKKDNCAIFVHYQSGAIASRIPELKPRPPMKVAASVLITRAGDMTNKGRSQIAEWLRSQAKNLVSHGARYSDNFRGRYYYS